jgi:hypothetical protein
VKALVPTEWPERRCICGKSGRRRQASVPSLFLVVALQRAWHACVGSALVARRGQSMVGQEGRRECAVQSDSMQSKVILILILIQSVVLPQSTSDRSAIRVWSQQAGRSFFLYISASPRALAPAWTLGAPKGLSASPATPWATRQPCPSHDAPLSIRATVPALIPPIRCHIGRPTSQCACLHSCCSTPPLQLVRQPQPPNGRVGSRAIDCCNALHTCCTPRVPSQFVIAPHEHSPPLTPTCICNRRVHLATTTTTTTIIIDPSGLSNAPTHTPSPPVPDHPTLSHCTQHHSAGSPGIA